MKPIKLLELYQESLEKWQNILNCGNSADWLFAKAKSPCAFCKYFRKEYYEDFCSECLIESEICRDDGLAGLVGEIGFDSNRKEILNIAAKVVDKLNENIIKLNYLL